MLGTVRGIVDGKILAAVMGTSVDSMKLDWKIAVCIEVGEKISY